MGEPLGKRVCIVGVVIYGVVWIWHVVNACYLEFGFAIVENCGGVGLMLSVSLYLLARCVLSSPCSC